MLAAFAAQGWVRWPGLPADMAETADDDGGAATCGGGLRTQVATMLLLLVEGWRAA
jgi:hypothetical protein